MHRVDVGVCRRTYWLFHRTISGSGHASKPKARDEEREKITVTIRDVCATTCIGTRDTRGKTRVAKARISRGELSMQVGWNKSWATRSLKSLRLEDAAIRRGLPILDPCSYARDRIFPSISNDPRPVARTQACVSPCSTFLDPHCLSSIQADWNASGIIRRNVNFVVFCTLLRSGLLQGKNIN